MENSHKKNFLSFYVEVMKYGGITLGSIPYREIHITNFSLNRFMSQNLLSTNVSKYNVFH